MERKKLKNKINILVRLLISMALCATISFLPLLASSIENDAAMAQIKKGENAIVERTIVMSSMLPGFYIICIAALTIIWFPVVRKIYEEKHLNN